MEARLITAAECIPLRAKVLRPGQPIDACHYLQDAEAVHFGAFSAGELMSTITAHPDQSPLFPGLGQWRIRGMATEPAFQGFGYGGIALEALLKWGREKKIPLFWCNAREKAIPFYEKHGFTIESEMFGIDGIGPHKVMKIDL